MTVLPRRIENALARLRDGKWRAKMPSAFDGYYPAGADGYDDGDQSGTHAGTQPRMQKTSEAASLTERLIQAAVDYESGRCSRRELSEARAAVEAAITSQSVSASQPTPRPTERWEVGKSGWDATDEMTREDI